MSSQSLPVQFPGDTRWEAIVNHYSLNIEEEDSFREFVEARYDYIQIGTLGLERLNELYQDWRKEQECP